MRMFIEAKKSILKSENLEFKKEMKKLIAFFEQDKYKYLLALQNLHKEEL